MKVKCPKCRQEYQLPSEQSGRSFSCLECGNDFVLKPTEPEAGRSSTRRGKSKLPWFIAAGILLAAAGAAALLTLLPERVESEKPVRITRQEAERFAFREAMRHIEENDALKLSRLLSTFNVNYEDENGETLLAACVRRKNRELLQVLISAGVNLNYENRNGEVALWGAIRGDDLSTVEFLVSRGARLNAGSSDTALGIAAEKGFFDIVSYLAASGENFLEYGERPKAIFRAIAQGHTDCVKALLPKYSIEETDEQGNTILLAAIENGNTDIARLALERSAYADARNRQGDSAFLIALKNNRDDILKLMARNGVDPDQTDSEGVSLPMLCARSGHIDLLRRFLNPKNINFTDQSGRSALYYACRAGKQAAFDLLLKQGAEVNAGNFSVSPLHAAITTGYSYGVEKLLAAGADIAGQDDKKNNALMLAARNGNPEIFQLLFATGKFDILQFNEEKLNAYDLAMESGHEKIAAALKRRMDADLSEKLKKQTDVLAAATGLSYRQLNEQLTALEKQAEHLPEAKSHIAAVRTGIEERERKKQQTAMKAAISQAKKDKFYESAIKILEDAIESNPLADSLKEAETYLAELKNQLNAEEEQRAASRKRQETLNRMTQQEIKDEVSSFIGNWLTAMQRQSDTSSYWQYPSLAQTIHNVKSWELTGTRAGAAWSPNYNTLIVMVESSTQGGNPVRKNRTVKIARNDGMQWKILSLEE